MREARRAAETWVQTQHDLRKAKPCIVDSNAGVAGQRHFQASAQTEPVNDCNAWNLQRLKTVDDRMRLADFGLYLAWISRAAKLVDVSARDEARWLRRADDQPGRTLAFEHSNDLAKLFQHIGRKRVSARAFAVEQQPRDAISITCQLEVLIRPCCWCRPEFEHMILQNVHDPAVHDRSLYTVSINMAPPRPPPMHSVAMPRFVPSRFIALTRCSTMRLPLVPTGWPRLMAPPSTFSLV